MPKSESASFDDTMSVLITGACGFLGVVVTELFLQQGSHITALDLPNAIEKMPSDLVENPRLHTLPADLLNDDFKSELPSQIDYVVHLAGLAAAGESFKNPDLYEQVNSVGTRILLNALEAHAIKKFILSSTAAVYGKESSDNTDEDVSLNPLSPYARSKVLAEQSVLKQGKSSGFNTVILRFFNIYGPGQRMGQSDIITLFIRSILEEGKIVILGDGSRTRSFIHVRDCARAILLSCTADTGDSAIINVCSEDSTSIIELAEKLIQFSGRKDILIEYKQQDDPFVMKSGCTGTAAQTLMGFRPQIPFELGLSETYEFLSTLQPQ
ncbi:MAG: NAD-dependent epimerase/dehydratase family protein [Candidatus Sifarchaeia archaeon]